MQASLWISYPSLERVLMSEESVSYPYSFEKGICCLSCHQRCWCSLCPNGTVCLCCEQSWLTDPRRTYQPKHLKMLALWHCRQYEMPRYSAPDHALTQLSSLPLLLSPGQSGLATAAGILPFGGLEAVECPEAAGPGCCSGCPGATRGFCVAPSLQGLQKAWHLSPKLGGKINNEQGTDRAGETRIRERVRRCT